MKNIKSQSGICKVCGCSMNNPCYNPKQGFCWWADESETLCSHCESKSIKDDKETVHCVNDIPCWEAPLLVNKDGITVNCLNELETDWETEIICPCCGYKPSTEDYSSIIGEAKHECEVCGCVYEAEAYHRFSTTCVKYRTDGR
ncbi:MAG: hypothetical protein IJR39_12260 [Treponema sp.]|nr:hypothetical protein [Treponema sp.]